MRKTKKQKINTLLSIILLSLITIFFISVIYFISNPVEKEKFTEFYILGEYGKANDYPMDLSPGDDTNIFIGVSNHEQKTIEYTIDIWLVNQSINDNNTIIDNAWFKDKIKIKLDHVDINTDKKWKPQWEYKYNFNISKNEGKYKLIFLLYKEDTDEYNIGDNYIQEFEEILKNSYQEVYLWINII